MQKRITTKDYLLFGFLSLIILLIILTMVQIDRQWLKLADMDRALAEQSKDVSALRGLTSQMQRKLADADLSQASAKVATGSAIEDSNGISPAFQDAYTATQQ